MNLFNFDHKNRCTGISQEFLYDANVDPDLLKTAITRDESWTHGNDVEIKVQLFQISPAKPRPNIARFGPSVKVLLLVSITTVP